MVDLTPVVQELGARRQPKCRTIVTTCQPLKGRKCGAGVERRYIICEEASGDGNRLIRPSSVSTSCFKPCPHKRKCRNPGELKNGRRSTSRNFTKSVKFTCNSGYLMVGQALMKCFVGPTGPQWRSEKPRCFREGGAYDRAWGDWSPCSSSCGAGTQKRQRMACTYNVGDRSAKRCREHFRVCNLKPCEMDFAQRSLFSWTDWSTCEAGERFRFRRRKASDDLSIWWLANLTTTGQPDQPVSFQIDSCCPLFRKSLHYPSISPELRQIKSRLRCPRGTWNKTGHRGVSHGCELCPIGKYAACKGQTSCVQCPPGYTTVQTGSVSLSQCERLKRGVNHQLTTLPASPYMQFE